MSHLERDVLAAGEFDAMVERIAARELDPYTAAKDLLTARWHSRRRDHRDARRNGATAIIGGSCALVPSL